MTFDEARQKLLSDLDAAHALIRTSVGDKNMCNDEWKDYKRSVTRYYETLQNIIKLNQAEMVSKW